VFGFGAPVVRTAGWILAVAHHGVSRWVGDARHSAGGVEST
jgi:hypothetical protein